MLALVALGALAFMGCNDSVAPNDQLEVTDEDVAHQAGFVARTIVNVLPEMASKSASEAVYLDPPFSGGFYHDTIPNERVFTDADLFLSLVLEDYGTTVVFTFDVSASGNPLVANGAGSITSGPLYMTFAVIDVAVVDGYPTSGSVEVTGSSSRVATITFDGDHTATITINSLEFTVDLDTGQIIG